MRIRHWDAVFGRHRDKLAESGSNLEKPGPIRRNSCNFRLFLAVLGPDQDRFGQSRPHLLGPQPNLAAIGADAFTTKAFRDDGSPEAVDTASGETHSAQRHVPALTADLTSSRVRPGILHCGRTARLIPQSTSTNTRRNNTRAEHEGNPHTARVLAERQEATRRVGRREVVPSGLGHRRSRPGQRRQ